MATWPASLPDDALYNGFSESLPDNTIRSPMSVGPAKLRRRATAAPRKTPMRLFLPTSDVATFDTFYVTTLKYGSLPFDWIRQRTTAVASYRFLKPPVYTHATPSNWWVDMDLEELP